MRRLLSPILAAALSLATPFALPRAAAAARPAPAPPDTLLAALLHEAEALQDARRWAALDSVAVLALERAQRRQPADSSAMARALFYRGSSRYGRAQYGDSLAAAAIARSLRIQQRLARPDTARWIATFDLYARWLTESDRADSALAVLSAARAVCRPAVTDADSMLADLWISTGRAHRRQDRFDQAIADYDSARALRERRFGPAHAKVGEVLAEIGAAYGRMNRLDEAERTLERAIGILERALGPESAALTTPLAELANAQNHAGDVARSIETLERDVAIHAKVNGPNSPRIIAPLFNIALRLFLFGDYAGAREIYAGLVPRAEAAFGAGNSRTEYVRYMAGASALLMDDTTAAAQYLTRTREELKGKPMDIAHTVNSIERYYSMLLVKRGDLAGARRVVAEGLARERATAQPIPDVLMELLDSQATIQLASRDSLGLDSTLAAMAVEFGDASKAEGVFYGDYLRSRANLENRRGRRAAAWDYALRSEQVDRERLLRNVRALPDQRALQMAGDLSEPLELLVALAREGDEASIATAWDRVVRWRGLVTAELAQRRAPHAAGADTALMSAHARWVEAVRHAARLEVESAEGGDEAALATSRVEADAAARRYAALAAARGIARDTAQVDFARVRAALAPDEALVSLLTVASRTDSARVMGFVTLGAHGALRRVDLGPSRVLSDRIAAWRAALETPPARGREASRERECRALGDDVRSRTWDRLAPRFAGATRVVLVADGALGDLPWQALPTARDRYLVETGPEIETPDAERELLAAPARGGHGLLALGDPDFERADGARDAAHLASAPTRGADECAEAIALAPLPGARAEVDDIAQAWNAAHAADRATPLVGAAASERAFKASAPGREIVHLATHGIVSGGRCGPGFAGLRGVGGIAPLAADSSAARPATTRPGATPVKTSASAKTRPAAPAATNASASPTTALHTSPWSGRQVWLALAGANHARAGGADENEGLLTADEVVTLDLSDADWVVLSACQSGVGKQWPLEGSVGMRRAFRLAGAHAVIASQWAIADEATREWMRALYAARSEAGEPASHALRAASRNVLDARRHQHRTTHPFYWAAFAATGR